MPDLRVAAVVPLFNGERFISECLDSLIAESFVKQITVVDDGSSDHGPTLVSRDFPGVTLLRQANAGVSKARNTGMYEVDSEFLIFLDQDDLLIEGSLDKFVEIAEAEGADFVYGDYLQIDESGLSSQIVRQLDVTADPAKFLLDQNCSASVCCLYRRSKLLEVGGFDEEMMGCEDWDLYLRLAQAGARFRYIPLPFFKFRYHPSSASKRFWLMWDCFKRFESKHHAATVQLPNGRELEVRRRDRFLNDNLRFLYGCDDLRAGWMRRRLNRTGHFLSTLLRDFRLARELARRSISRPQP